MENWRRVWREGLVPQFSRAGLCALESALINDNPHLIQGAITLPPPLDALRGREVEGTCAISYCAWHGEGLTRVAEVEHSFHRICEAADAVFHEPACRYFFQWYDEASRKEMRRALLAEVVLALRKSMNAVA